MKRQVSYKGFRFNEHISSIEEFFSAVSGIRIEQINRDVIVLKTKRYLPVKRFGELTYELMKKLKEERDGKLCTVPDDGLGLDTDV
jgi:hypothetical protein